MFCPRCGNPSDSTARFCQVCGTSLPLIEAEATAYQTHTQDPFLTSNVSSHVQYAGFWRRLVAWVIDYFVSYVIMIIIAFSAGMMMGLSGYSDDSLFEFIGFIVAIITPWLYWSIMESSSKRATFGKMAMGIIVTDYQGNKISFGRATARYWAKILSALIFCIGFFMAGFTAKKQGLHDIVTECLVVENSPHQSPSQQPYHTPQAIQSSNSQDNSVFR
ncbi:MAG: RDD family protein [Chloroflexota bacterium]|nr:RDD family protein [Chloroflexota bacterium]